YSITFSNGTLTISKAALAVIADHQSRVFSAPNPPFSYHFGGFVNGETVSVISGAPDLTTTADLATPIGSYPISVGLGTLSAANYEFTFEQGILDITRASSTLLAASSLNPAMQFSNVTFTATVGPISPAAAIPTGIVQFRT